MQRHGYDLFVIGGGSGGVRAARIAASHGANVAIAEENRFGGTCVIRGCVPKKLFVYASRFGEDFDDAVGFGWRASRPPFDWPSLVANKDMEIAGLERLYRVGLERAGVAIFESRAELVDAHTVLLRATGHLISARTILIASGSRPVVPDIPGAKHAITSNDAFHLKRLPSSLLIVGGGYIGIEFACIFNCFGVKTTLLCRGEHMLRGFDDELRNVLAQQLCKRGIDVRWNPNTLGLGAEAMGVNVGARGEIIVNDHSQTSVESIYAIGDVTDRLNLTPVAIRVGHAFADSV